MPSCKDKHPAGLRQEAMRHKQLPEKIQLLGRLLDGLNNEQLAAELSRHGFALNEVWELGILVDSALRAAHKL